MGIEETLVKEKLFRVIEVVETSSIQEANQFLNADCILLGTVECKNENGDGYFLYSLGRLRRSAV